MKPHLFFLLFVIAFMDLKAQSLEVSTLYNISSEPRLDKCPGIGLMYSHNVSKKFVLGLSVFYKYNHSRFVKNGSLDSYLSFAEVDSRSNSISIRSGFQYIGIDMERIGLSFGSEISYNILWGSENSISYFRHNNPPPIVFQGNYHPSKSLGIGFLLKLEIRKIFIDNLALCINIRPELATTSNFDSVSTFQTFFVNGEFMAGLKYKLTKN